MLTLSKTPDITPLWKFMICTHLYTLQNVSVLGLCLRINGYGLFAWIALFQIYFILYRLLSAFVKVLPCDISRPKIFKICHLVLKTFTTKAPIVKYCGLDHFIGILVILYLHEQQFDWIISCENERVLSNLACF